MHPRNSCDTPPTARKRLERRATRRAGPHGPGWLKDGSNALLWLRNKTHPPSLRGSRHGDWSPFGLIFEIRSDEAASLGGLKLLLQLEFHFYRGAVAMKWRPAMAIFEGPEKNRNIIIVIAALVVIAAIIYFYGGRF
jgi:hypothetical protein